MSAVLLLAGWLLRRTTFVAQSLAALALTLVHAAVVDLFIAPAQTAFTATRVFVVGAMCAVLLLTLPIAFAVRRRFADSAADDWVDLVLSRPEQPFFVAPLLLLVALLALQLHGGMITVGWSALGVAAFLFALTVRERSYRLAGLAVLMLGAGKNPGDRYMERFHQRPLVYADRDGCGVAADFISRFALPGDAAQALVRIGVSC